MNINWYDIDPKDAVDLDLSIRLDITAPLNEEGERCPWPWEPQLRLGTPMGQYHCPYCGAMVLAGNPHLDYREGTRHQAQVAEAGNRIATEHKDILDRLA